MLMVAEKRNGETVEWRDTKRHLWFLSVISPSLPGVSAALLFQGASVWFALMPLIVYYVVIPILDMLVGEDTSNPPEEVIEQLSSDNYYRALLHLSVPVFYASFFAVFAAIGMLDLPLWAILALVVSCGVASGSGLTVSHELGHKQNRLDRLSAKVMAALVGYAHFNIEHNQGHHVQVATPEDGASARYGESLYRFAFRELPSVAKRGWGLERRRLERKGYRFWSIHNDLLQGYAITLVIAAAMVATLGWWVLPLLVLHHAIGWFQLTMANYVEHYGLLRPMRANGTRVPCQPEHSWNTNHLVSNLMLFHLQRHSDHHANPMRPYQSLRNFEELPRLPSGYPGCFTLASFPPAWFAVMNPKVLAWADGDMARINTGPDASESGIH